MKIAAQPKAWSRVYPAGDGRWEHSGLPQCNHTAIKPLAIGLGLRTKVNANIGTSKDNNDLILELKN